METHGLHRRIASFDADARDNMLVVSYATLCSNFRGTSDKVRSSCFKSINLPAVAFGTTVSSLLSNWVASIRVHPLVGSTCATLLLMVLAAFYTPMEAVQLVMWDPSIIEQAHPSAIIALMTSLPAVTSLGAALSSLTCYSVVCQRQPNRQRMFIWLTTFLYLLANRDMHVPFVPSPDLAGFLPPTLPNAPVVYEYGKADTTANNMYSTLHAFMGQGLMSTWLECPTWCVMMCNLRAEERVELGLWLSDGFASDAIRSNALSTASPTLRTTYTYLQDANIRRRLFDEAPTFMKYVMNTAFATLSFANPDTIKAFTAFFEELAIGAMPTLGLGYTILMIGQLGLTACQITGMPLSRFVAAADPIANIMRCSVICMKWHDAMKRGEIARAHVYLAYEGMLMALDPTTPPHNYNLSLNIRLLGAIFSNNRFATQTVLMLIPRARSMYSACRHHLLSNLYPNAILYYATFSVGCGTVTIYTNIRRPTFKTRKSFALSWLREFHTFLCDNVLDGDEFALTEPQIANFMNYLSSFESAADFEAAKNAAVTAFDEHMFAIGAATTILPPLPAP